MESHAHHRQASASFISTTIQAKLQDHPMYRLADVKRDIHREYGVQVHYSTAWRAKELSLDAINGSHETVFNRVVVGGFFRGYK